MHLPATVLIFFFVISAVVYQSDAASKSCNKSCPNDKRPVCGTFYRQNGRGFISCTFDNICKLNSRECHADESE